MKDASQFSITTPYGQVAGYPLNNGFHNGIDYGCPVGTPVVVNGVQIGLSGDTGFVTGAHLHVGRWVNGQVTNPVGGFTFDSAVVTEVSEDSLNGKYIRVEDDGASWVYLHLSKQTAVVGEELKGEDMGQIEALTAQRDDVMNKLIAAEKANVPGGEEVTKAFLAIEKKEPSKDQYVFYTTNPRVVLYNDLLGLKIVK